MVPLGEYVMRKACAQIAAWRSADPALASLSVCVNLSPDELRHEQLPDQIEAVLAQSGLEPSALIVELTESGAMADTGATLRVLSRLQRLGVRIALDDFGTGHSSLSYLKHLPIDEIKIDRSFVAGMSTDPSDATIVRSIIDLGHNLGHTVVAEGVEEPDTLERLVAQGCDQAQGYLISRPLPASDVSALLGRVDSWSAEVPQ